MKTNRLVVLSLAVLAILAAPAARATTYYVSTGGHGDAPSDGYTTAQAQNINTPWQTINHGVSFLHPGDTLYIRGGVYPESLLNGVIPSGTATQWVIVSNYLNESVILRPAYGPALYRVLEITDESFININGLVFDGINLTINDANPVKFFSSSTGLGRPHDIVLQNFEVLNGYTEGVLGEGTNISFLNCKVHHNGHVSDYGPGYCGFYWEGDHSLIDHCDIYNNMGVGADIWDANTTTSDPSAIVGSNTLRNSSLHNNKRTTLTIGPMPGRGVICAANVGPQNCLIYNNLIYANDVGIALTYYSQNTTVYNNTVYGNISSIPGYGIGIWVINPNGTGGPVINNVIENNIAFGNGIDLLNANGTTDGTDALGNTFADNLIGDPRFVNAAGMNFQLQFGSPAIGTGANLRPIVTDDFAGVQRPLTGAFDIGAYQYVASGGSVSAVPIKPTGVRWQ